MRLFLLLALLLYDIVVNASRQNNYDFIDNDLAKRHADDRRNYRKKILMKPSDPERDWEDRRYEKTKYYEEAESGLGIGDKQRELEPPMTGYGGKRRYDEKESAARTRTAEVQHEHFVDKGDDKRIHNSMECGRQYERYEPCFAGCAAVSCDNPRDRLRPCYPFCEPGCICVHPHVRDDRTHKCVLPDDCTKGLKGIPDLGEDI